MSFKISFEVLGKCRSTFEPNCGFSSDFFCFFPYGIFDSLAGVGLRYAFRMFEPR